MAREVTPEERERARQGGIWLRETRKRFGWATGTSFAEDLGIKQNRLSSYENGLFLVEDRVAERIAQLFKMPELEVWRALGLKLPREARSDDALDDYYEQKYPDVFAGVEKRTGIKVTSTGDKPEHAPDRRRRLARKSDSRRQPPQERATGA